jgi:hypothetical protein
MSIYDKFGIIENHLKSEDKKNIVNKIENYFENFLNSDMRVLVSDYVNQVIWFEGINLENFSVNVDSHLKNYLIQRRNNMRTFIKKESFELVNLNKFLKNFISKLEYLNNIIKSHDDRVIKEGIKQLTNLIISDSFILLFIEEQIAPLNKEIVSEIQTLVTLVKQLAKYDNFETFNKIIMTFANIFVKQIVDMEEPPLPENIKRIQKLNETIKYCRQVKEYFHFMDGDIYRINQQIYSLIIESLTSIIKNNTLDEIEYVFEHIWSNINKLITETKFDGKDELLNTISTEIINLVDRSLRNQNSSDTFKIINVLKYADSIVSQSTHKEIINQKISNTLSSEDLVENIQINIDCLIRNSKEKDVIKLLNFVFNVKDKDMFIAKYYQYLTKRLMEKISVFSSHNSVPKEYLLTEKKVFEYLKNKFGDKLVYKLNKVIVDTEFSFEDNLNFNKLNIENFENKMTVITTSFNNWDVNQNEGLVSSKMVESIKNTQLGKHLRNYQKYYELRYCNKRLLNWFPHFGEVNVGYMGKDIQMLPIQFMVLEMFNDVNRLPIKDVSKADFFTNYSSKFVNDIVGSLVASGLFKIQNETMILTSNTNFSTNLIEVFFNTSDYANIWEQRRKEELALSREEIVCANINHHIKTKPMDKKELFEVVSKVIEIFELDQTVFDKAIEYMCKMDYIKSNGEVYEKIVY